MPVACLIVKSAGCRGCVSISVPIRGTEAEVNAASPVASTAVIAATVPATAIVASAIITTTAVHAGSVRTATREAARNATTGMIQRYTQVTFEMIDLENGTIVWSNLYELSRSAADSVVYR